jgi:hypothetical protein
VETALWAAAGGDVARLRDLLQLDDAVRTRAGEVLARLPEAARASYLGPDDLVAAFTTKAIPLGDAQLVWLHESGPDDAVACVFVKNTNPVDRGPCRRRRDLRRTRFRPWRPRTKRPSQPYLSLRRIDDTWRVVVPMSAVENIAKELGWPGPALMRASLGRDGTRIRRCGADSMETRRNSAAIVIRQPVSSPWQ